MDLFLSEPDGWVLKGATALLASWAAPRGTARHALDVDLYRPERATRECEGGASCGAWYMLDRMLGAGVLVGLLTGR